ncbi:MAG: hypothetical protein EB027_07375, partial [Actinobacteria bacterium]|nr:hypothetical protein [Actinomycetota bacterium]
RLEATDQTRAIVGRAQIDAAGLAIRATHDGDYLGRARTVDQAMSGGTLAAFNDSVFKGGALQVRASDQGSYGARAADLEFDVKDASTTSVLSVRQSRASNLIDRGIQAEVARTTVDASSVVVDAANSQRIIARAGAQVVRDSAAAATGIQTTGKSLDVAGVLALNQVNGALLAQLVDSNVKTSGAVTVRARNEALIDARAQAGSNTVGSGSVGAAIAFNAIGSRLDGNPLLIGLNALLLGEWGLRDPSDVRATVDRLNLGTSPGLQVGTDLTVQAIQSLTVNATVSNLSEVTATASFGAASAMSAAGVFASNRVVGQSQASLQNSPKLRVGRDLLVDAQDRASILSNALLVAGGTSAPDGGIDLPEESREAVSGARAFDELSWSAFKTQLADLMGVPVTELGLQRPAYLDRSSIEASTAQ